MLNPSSPHSLVNLFLTGLCGAGGGGCWSGQAGVGGGGGEGP
jgi:hypothetical protein